VGQTLLVNERHTVSPPSQVNAAGGFRVGVDPAGCVFPIENHDDACRIWRDAGVKRRVLIHIDAHHDMWWIADARSLTIASFICMALREELVRDVYWVVPDASLKSRRARRPILRHIRRLLEDYPGPRSDVSLTPSLISTKVLGKRIIVCGVGSLPRVEEEVLLDIDVDYLTTPAVSYGQRDKCGPLPWRWPQELLAKLREQRLRADIVTIAYSVEGGYTPLEWKYLGDELATRLRRPDDREATRGFETVRDAAETAHKGDIASAERKYRNAMDLAPVSAAACFHLAHLYAGIGRIEEGRGLYQRALEIDPTYRTPYNCRGLQYYGSREFFEAERVYRRTVALDPKDAYAYLGLGRLEARRRNWTEAEALLRRSLALNAKVIDAYRALGDVLVRLGRTAEAIEAYEQSLKLAMHGYKPLLGASATDPGEHRILDTDHLLTHAKLARAHERQGELGRAANGYRMSIRGGNRDAGVALRLAWLSLKQRQWRAAAAAAWDAGRKALRHGAAGAWLFLRFT